MKRLLASLFLSLVMILGISPVTAFAASPETSSNYGKHNYSNRRWSQTITSYLYDNGRGLTRVEYTGNHVVIENYDKGFAFLSGFTIDMELPIWGGFYAGEDYNFLIFGQSNYEQSDGAEVVRVVKYSKNWRRLGHASLYGANTVKPFDAGSLRCAEYGGILYVRTCHLMYLSDDGKHHQANMTFCVNEESMTITDSAHKVSNNSYGYISHSFNQFILVDAEQNIVTLDHGDAYPRALVLMRAYQKAGDFTSAGRFASIEFVTFPGEIGNNTTGASVGGLTETRNGYMTAYSWDETNSYQAQEIYLSYFTKDIFEAGGGTETRYRLSSTGVSNTTPVIAPTGLDGGYVLWASGNGRTPGVYYISYDADGDISEVSVIPDAYLSDCQPIPYGDGVVWYVTANSAPVFYVLDK